MTNQHNQQTLKGWQLQLQDVVAPYVQEARDRSHGLSVVLFLRPDGKLGAPKISISTGDPRQGVEPE